MSRPAPAGPGGFVVPMRLWLSVCACVLVPVGGGPPARSPHASCARSGRSRSPARPCRRPPAPRPGPRCSPHRRCGATTAHRHRGLALHWSLRHYANPSNNERPGPQPHNQTLNNVRTRPVVQCLPMGRCAYPRLGLLVWALHPIRRHYTPSVRVRRHLTGAPPTAPTGTAAGPRRPRGGLQSVGACCLCVACPGPMRISRRVRRA